MAIDSGERLLQTRLGDDASHGRNGCANGLDVDAGLRQRPKHRRSNAGTLAKVRAKNSDAGGTTIVHDAARPYGCLLYTSDAAAERLSVGFGGVRIIKKKKKLKTHGQRERGGEDTR